MSITIQKEQLPAGAQQSGGGTPVGVIDEGLNEQGDVLAYQAAQAARLKAGATLYNDGAAFSPELLERIAGNVFPGIAHVNAQTVEALQSGQLQRDQNYTGSNAKWTGFYLEPAAKFVYPFNTPLKNRLPRVPGVGIDKINWRAITDLFNGTGPTVGNFILQQGGSPPNLTYVWKDAENVFKTLSVQDKVALEAELYGRLFAGDVKARVVAKLIPALMLGQEVWYINGAQKLWAGAPASNISNSATGGTVLAGTYWFLLTAVNANGETLAFSPTAVSQVTTGTTSTITFNIFRVPGAVSYNVYVGSGGTQPANSAMWRQGAAAQFGNANALNDPGGLAQGYFSVTMSAAPVTSGTAYSTIVTAGNTAIGFKSTDPDTLDQPLVFDGIQSLIYLNAGAGSTNYTGGETPIIRQPAAANGSLVQSDIDTFLERMYLNSGANPDCLLCSVVDHKLLTKIVTSGTNFRVTSPNTAMDALIGGGRAVKYINQTTGKIMDILMLPYLTQGTLIAASFELPFPVAEIDGPPLRIEYNRDMWAVEYPPDQSAMTKWRYAAFSNETMICQYLGGLGIINGISLL